MSTTTPTEKLIEARLQEVNQAIETRTKQLKELQEEKASHEMALKLINNALAKQEAIG